MISAPKFVTAIVLTLLILTLSAPAVAMTRDDVTPLQRLDNFAHYTFIARPGLAASEIRMLFDEVVTDAELARIVDETALDVARFEQALSRARNLPELASLAGELEARIEQGRLDLARDPDRIREAIAMLEGTQRAQLLAQRRLAAAGEYAVPFLLREVTEGRNERLRQRCESSLRSIGRVAVTPLSVALENLGERNQRIVCNILADIGYPHAAPYLMEIAESPQVSEVTRETAMRAFRRVGGIEGELTTQYTRLANQYFHGLSSLLAYPADETNNVWGWDRQIGLVATAVPTPIHSQVMAMQSSQRALGFDRTNRNALSIYVASNLKRQNNLPDDAEDPIFGDEAYTPEFYATVFGPSISLQVLSMALENRDTRLVRDAVEALSHTAGSSTLIAADRVPLTEALYYPDRRVQYDAALALGAALPEENFDGSVAVVPTLASAVRTGGQNFALVIADDAEDREVFGDRLEDMGFDIIARSPTFEQAQSQIVEAIGVDLIIVAKRSAGAAQNVVSQLRTEPRTTVAPILIVATESDLISLQPEYAHEPTVHLARTGLGDAAFRSATEGLLDRAVGGLMTEFEGEIYAIRSLEVLGMIAVNQSAVYNIADAESSLLEALEVRYGGLRNEIAGIVSRINSPRSQRRLLDIAFGSEGTEQVQLLDHAARSVKRFGNLSEPRHARMLVELIRTSSGATAEAAARLHGAMDLPPDSAIELILK